MGAAGADAYSLLAAIGADCVGALQFVAADDDRPDHDDDHHGGGGDDPTTIAGTPVGDEAIEALLRGLAQTPLGLSREDPFRISVAGAQEKTALLRHDGGWLKPHGTTPTTHILKTQIGQLPDGVDLSNSVENEYYCLKLAEAFALPVNQAAMQNFGSTRALIIERFDRRWPRTGRLLRLPQEDCCQALAVAPTRKYQSDGGPGIVDVLTLLKGSDEPAADQQTVFKAQILFWLMGATDGHAKNFSLFLSPGGGYRLTLLYDVLAAQPSLNSLQIERKQMKLAMSMGTRRHYRIEEIVGGHFVQTGQGAGLPRTHINNAIEDMADNAAHALENTAQALPADFPPDIHDSVSTGVLQRVRRLASGART